MTPGPSIFLQGRKAEQKLDDRALCQEVLCVPSLSAGNTWPLLAGPARAQAGDQ